MRRPAMRGAAVLAVLAALAVPGGGALAADCWLLDAPALDRAQAEGRCQDVFARSAPPADPPAAKPAPARTAKAARRPPAKAIGAKAAVARAQPSLAVSLERLFGRYKPARGSAGRAPGGGIDHLSYGRAERNPVQR